MGTLEVLAERYELREVIAAGGVGTVWRGRDRVTGQPVAVKVLSEEAARQPDVVAAFRDEAQMMNEIHHPGVVRCRAFLPDEQALVMDLVGGTDLGRRLRATGPLPPGEAAEVLARVCAALAAVHGAGIVHGDIKPSNILVPEADPDGVKLADFGVAHRVLRPTEATHATPEYVAPEVVAGQPASPASDLYGVGLVLYEAMVGRSPYRGGSVEEVLDRHANCELVPVPGIPAVLWQVIERCLALAANRRPTAAELAVTLRDGAPDLAELPAVQLAADAPLYQPRTTPFVGIDDLLATSVAGTAAVPERRSGRDPKLLIGAGVVGVALVAALAVGGWLAFGAAGGSPQADHHQPKTSTSAGPHRSPSAGPSTPASPSPAPATSQPGDGGQPASPQPTSPDDGGTGQSTDPGTGGDPGIGQPMPTLPMAPG